MDRMKVAAATTAGITTEDASSISAGIRQVALNVYATLGGDWPMMV